MEIHAMLDPTTVAQMQAVVADVDSSESAHIIPGTSIRVTRKATDPVPPRRLTAADALVIDSRSGAMIEALCVDCRTSLLIDPSVPEGVDPDAPRIPICSACARTRCRLEAIEARRNVQAIRRTRVAKHQPPITDGIDHPVTVTNPAKKENDMDLDNMSDAELGALVRNQMKAAKVETIKAGKPEVEKERKEKAKKAKREVAQEQKARSLRVLDGFKVGTTLEVPTLDLSEVTSLDEAPSAKERSPYNKARFRLTKEGPLDPEETTYRSLMDEHLRLQGIESKRVSEVAEKPAKKAKAQKAKVNAVAADLDPATDAKVSALASVLGVSEKKARKIMAGL